MLHRVLMPSGRPGQSEAAKPQTRCSGFGPGCRPMRTSLTQVCPEEHSTARTQAKLHTHTKLECRGLTIPDAPLRRASKRPSFPVLPPTPDRWHGRTEPSRRLTLGALRGPSDAWATRRFDALQRTKGVHIPVKNRQPVRWPRATPERPGSVPGTRSALLSRGALTI